jgi:very-short-patch-repair endonuclease
MRRAVLAFDRQCELAKLPKPVAEWRFWSGRRHRFDWAWLPQRIAVEIEGGAFTRGRHTRGVGFVKDMEKYNAAALLGWRVLRFTPAQVNDGTALSVVERALKSDDVLAIDRNVEG